jgi:lipopolysaccharide export LptBFGC system permease protein LptF
MMAFGGGLLDMMRNQGISAREMLKLLVYLMPIVLAYSLPVSALFSTTITYGRFSTDNEINACRASGINIHRLLIPAVILSLFVFGVTFVLENYLIPNLASKIETLVKADMQKFAYLQLKNQGYIDKMDFALHCGKIEKVVNPEVQADGTVSSGQIQLSHVAFMDHKDNSPLFYGTAQKALIVFDTLNEKPTVSVHLNQIRAFDEKQGQMIQTSYYAIPPIDIPPMSRKKIKFRSLPELMEIVRDPLSYPELKSLETRLEMNLRNALAYEVLVSQIQQNWECRMSNGKNRCTVTADKFRQVKDKDGHLVLEGNVVVKESLESGVKREYKGRLAYITAETVEADGTPFYMIEMKNEVSVKESRKGKPDRYGERKDPTVGPFQAPESVVQKAASIPLHELLEEDAPYDYNYRIGKLRGQMANEMRTTVGKAAAEIHGRAAYSASALVLLMLGAGLGIIFKGGHFVSAFGLSFIPMLMVVVMIMTGRQLTTTGIGAMGIVVIWLGVAVVGAANVIVLGKFLKR